MATPKSKDTRARRKHDHHHAANPHDLENLGSETALEFNSIPQVMENDFGNVWQPFDGSFAAKPESKAMASRLRVVDDRKPAAGRHDVMKATDCAYEQQHATRSKEYHHSNHPYHHTQRNCQQKRKSSHRGGGGEREEYGRENDKTRGRKKAPGRYGEEEDEVPPPSKPQYYYDEEAPQTVDNNGKIEGQPSGKGK
jgi:hypothetical protein